MDIGIIGAGHIGGTLAGHLVKAGHSVIIANSRGPETLKDLATKTGATAGTIEQAVRNKQVVIVTIPEKAIPDLPADLFAGMPADAAVIDTGNYYPSRDGAIADIIAGLPDSRWVEQQLGRPVVKAFNCIFAESLANKGKPAGSPDRVTLPVCGDDPMAKAVVLKLIDDIGFDALDAGGLEISWRQQPGTPVYCQDYDLVGVSRALAEAERDKMPEYRAAADKRAALMAD